MPTERALLSAGMPPTELIVLRLAQETPPPTPCLRVLLGTPLHRSAFDVFGDGQLRVAGHCAMPTDRVTHTDEGPAQVFLLHLPGDLVPAP